MQLVPGVLPVCLPHLSSPVCSFLGHLVIWLLLWLCLSFSTLSPNYPLSLPLFSSLPLLSQFLPLSSPFPLAPIFFLSSLLSLSHSNAVSGIVSLFKCLFLTVPHIPFGHLRSSQVACGADANKIPIVASRSVAPLVLDKA